MKPLKTINFILNHGIYQYIRAIRLRRYLNSQRKVWATYATLDKVTMAEYLVADSPKNSCVRKEVYQVVRVHKGFNPKLDLHCGTYLLASQAKKLPKETPIRT